MNVNELHKHVNDLREKRGLPSLSKKKFLRDITIMHLEGKITVENGEVKSAKEKEN